MENQTENSRSTPVGRCSRRCASHALDRPDVPTDQCRDLAVAQRLVSLDLHVRSLDHRVGGLDRAHKALRLDQPQGASGPGAIRRRDPS
jgi:hypothetical protein